MVIRRMIPRTARIRFVFFMVKPPDGLFSWQLYKRYVKKAMEEVTTEERTAQKAKGKKKKKKTVYNDKPKAGRNDPCPCGSGKKYKNCCWDKDHIS